MTNVHFRIDSVNRGNNVLQADIWRNAMTGIGRWEVVLDPLNVDWTGVFAVDNGITIGINGVIMMRGYLDDAERFLDSTGVYSELWRLNGRDYGMDLAQLYITQEYPNQRADNIVQAALTAAGSEIGYVSFGVAPFINYEFRRTYLSDGIREIAERANNLGENYDFYVDDTPVPFGPVLHFFRVGSPAEISGVQLLSVAGFAGNNILKINPLGEALGFGLKNYVEVYCSQVNDHWTDMNAAGWTGINANVTNLSPPPALNALHGKSSLKVTNNTGGLSAIGVELRFPTYNHVSLDMSASGTGKYDYLMYDTNTAIKRCRIRLYDINNNIIEYYQAGLLGLSKCYQCTDQPTNGQWRKVTFPIGAESGIEPALVASNKGYWWAFNMPAPPFDWSQVTRIQFSTVNSFLNPTDFFLLDGLSLSNVEPISIAQSIAPIGGTRMKSFYRPDLKSQVEMDALSPQILAKLEYPLEKINILAIGQTGSRYSGQRLQVQAPNSGIPAVTNYRVFSLHHRVTKSSADSPYPGYNFTTEYDLIRHTVASGVQNVDPDRVWTSNDATQGSIPVMINKQRYMSSPDQQLP